MFKCKFHRWFTFCWSTNQLMQCNYIVSPLSLTCHYSQMIITEWIRISSEQENLVLCVTSRLWHVSSTFDHPGSAFLLSEARRGGQPTQPRHAATTPADNLLWCHRWSEAPKSENSSLTKYFWLPLAIFFCFQLYFSVLDKDFIWLLESLTRSWVASMLRRGRDEGDESGAGWYGHQI